jgi:uncharacterized protein
MELSPEITLALLCLIGFLAGFVDAVVGGGGLIQLPGLLILYPSLPIPVAFGSSKLAGAAGTALAVRQYARHLTTPRPVLLLAAGSAFVCSFLGAQLVSLVSNEVLRPLILVLLVAVAIYTYSNKNFGTHHTPKLHGQRLLVFSVLTGAALGFYDGFFGPGTGSLLVFVFVSVFGYNFLAASATAKVINLATNVSALLFFIYTGQVRYDIALPLAACNIVGSYFGARLAILKGSGFVRVFFLVVVSAIILKFGYDSFFKD